MAAAADLAPLEKPLSEAFHNATGEKVTFTLGSSGMLARQIGQGAPYDVYLSANEGFVKDLTASGRIVAQSVRVYAFGRLGLWSKSGTVRSVRELLDKKVRAVAIANPAHAPYGMAARDTLKNQGLWDAVQPKLVYGENVRQAFQLAESGNADAVITSWTLIFDKGAVLLPQEWHPPIRQAGGIVATANHKQAAEQFLEFLAGPEGQRLLHQGGLFAPTPSDGRDRKPPSNR